MAPITSFDASLAKLRKLFTSAERALLDSSTSKKLAAATESQVKSLLKQGRILRDKWRDLVGAQMRNTKRTRRPAGLQTVAAATKANERSRQKSDLLSTAVARLEARLQELAGGPAPAKPSGVKQTAAKRPAKAVATKAKAGRSVAIAAVQPRTISKKARQAGTRKALESVGTQGLNTSSATQRKATAALKADRLKIKGITTRRAGHAQSRVGKAQARRDQRNAGRK